MFKRIKLLLLSIVLSSTSFSTLAQQLQAFINASQVAKNEVIELTLIADFSADSEDIDFSVLDDDFFVGPPRFGRAKNYINGEWSTRTEWKVAIAPIRSGNVTIPSFSVDGATSRAISLNVQENTSIPDVSKLFYFEVDPHNTTLYPKQSTTLTTRLYIKGDSRSLQSAQIIPPSIEGLEIAPMGDATQNQYLENGTTTTLIQQDYRITATTEGEYTLIGPSLSASYVYRSGRNQAAQAIPFETEAEQIAYRVKPIPQDMVGEWLPANKLEVLQQFVDSNGQQLTNGQTISQGESITRTVVLHVDGLTPEQMPNLNFDYPSSIRVYPEQPSFDTHSDGSVVMTIKHVLIPSQPGELTLTTQSLTWWNSATSEKTETPIDGLSLTVEPSEAPLIMLPDDNFGAQTSTVIVEPTAGLWKPLAFLFAALWVITLGVALLLWKKRSMPVVAATRQISTATNEHSILKSGDAAKIEQYVQQWLTVNDTTLDPDKRESVQQELQKMHAAQFSQASSSWSPDTLVKLLNAPVKGRKTSNHSSLAKL